VKIKRIILSNFKNYKKKDIYFEKWGSFFYGKNGTGKTNLIEAIYMLSYFTGFRSIGNIGNMVRWESENSFIKAELEDEYGLTNFIEIFFNKKKSLALIIKKK